MFLFFKLSCLNSLLLSLENKPLCTVKLHQHYYFVKNIAHKKYSSMLIKKSLLQLRTKIKVMKMSSTVRKNFL